jgi:hypothetical protein
MSILDDLGKGVVQAGKDIVTGIGGVVGSIQDALGGPGSVLGLIFDAAATVLVGPTYNIPIFIGTVAATRALIKQRSLTGAEQAFARQFFGDTLPSFQRLLLTNLSGPGNGQFTIPDGVGNVLLNMGPAYDDPVNYKRQDASYPNPGQVFIHELTHAWQIRNSSFLPGFLCDAGYTQFRAKLGADVYHQTTIRDQSSLGRNWRDYNIEEQATIADSYFAVSNPVVSGVGAAADAGGLIMDANDPVRYLFYPYYLDVIRPGNPDADYVPYVPTGLLALMATEPQGVYWEVTYPDGVWYYTFSRNGTARFSQIPPGNALAASGTTRIASAEAAKPVIPARLSQVVSASRFTAASAAPRSPFTQTAAAAAQQPGQLNRLTNVTALGNRAAASATSRLTAAPANAIPIVDAPPTSTGWGIWRYQPGKIVVTWFPPNIVTQNLHFPGARAAAAQGATETEEWTLPLKLTGQTGRQLNGGDAFTARKLAPVTAPPDVVN